jgi:hypothetical protein
MAAARTEDVERTRVEIGRVGSLVGPPGLEFMHALHLAEPLATHGADADRRRVRAALVASGVVGLSGGPISFSYEGPVSRALGLLDASLGDLAGAEANLREALTFAERYGHRPWIAQTSYELSRVVRRAGRHAEARELFDVSVTIARELGMKGLAGREAPAPESGALVMTLEGEVWSVTHPPRIARVKDSRGMQLLARLVERPGEEIHVLSLASDEGVSLQETSAGEHLDEEARKAYRRRLAELETKEQTATVKRERAALEQELARAIGLGGRARRAGSATERARVNVQRRLRDAIARIAEVDAVLGKLLGNAVRTGTYCSYSG